MELIRGIDKTWELEYIDKSKTCMQIAERQRLKNFNINTTSIYREAYHIMKLGKEIKPLSERTKKAYEIRYYPSSPPVPKGKGWEQEPNEINQADTLEEALGWVFDKIGHPRNNRKMSEYLEGKT